MAQKNVCPLCVNPCGGPKDLYGANGVGNWVYQLTAKYFQSVFSNIAEKRATQLSNICSKCWRYIVDYHTFEQSISGAQAKKVLPAAENVCRLCVSSYGGDQFKRLFHSPDNEIYRITFKYMHSMFPNPDGQNLGAICLKCWDHLQKFHKFQSDVYESQKMLPKDEKTPHEVIVKMEEGSEMTVVNQSCASRTTEVKTEPLDLWSYETLDKSKLLANKISYTEPLADAKAEIDSASDQISTKEILSGFKDESYNPDSISLPKLEIMDVHSEDDSNQEEESDGQLNSKKRKSQTRRSRKSVPKYLDNIMAQCMPNISKICGERLKSRQGHNAHKIRDKIESYEKTTTERPSAKSHRELNTFLAQWWPVLDNDVQVKSDLLEYEMMDDSRLLDNEVSCNKTHEKQVRGKSEVDKIKYQNGTDDIHSDVKHGSSSQDSISLPTLEIMDVPSHNAHKSIQNSHNTHNESGTNAKTTAESASAKSHIDLNTFLAQWWKVLDREVQVKSKPKLLGKEISCNKTPDQLKPLDHDKQVRGEPEADDATEETPGGFAYSSYYRHRIPLSKLEIVDVPSETDSNQINLSDAILDEWKGPTFKRKTYSKTYTCNICGKTFHILSSYCSHNRKKHSNNGKPGNSYKEFDAFVAKWRTSLECELCGESSVDFTELKQHFRRKHPKAKCFITCCERKLKYRYQISEHIIIHMQPDTYKCEICDKCYNSKYSLRHHEKISHFNTKYKKSTQDEAKGNDKLLNEDN